MRGKQVFYFYEGETEKQLLEFLKNTKTLLLNVESMPLSPQNFDLNLSAF
jgi:hypothetical protein